MKPKALTIAGSDSGGGAGIQADLKTFASLGVWGSSAIVAITAQNSKEVTAVQNTELEVISKQVEAVVTDIGADAVKVGMLANKEIIACVAENIQKHNLKNIVLDPVMIAASGAKLLEDEAIETLKTKLFPLADIVTPNIPEAEVLVGFDIKTPEEMKKAAIDIHKLGCKSVLLKGGHLEGDKVSDLFYDREEFTEIQNKKLDKEGHGTGCTLSSAIAAHLAKGNTMKESVKKSVEYVHYALENGFKVGSQNYVLDHFYQK